MNKNIIQALQDWNPWEHREFPDSLAGFQREVDLLSYLKMREIKILEGARRVGKSTLLYQVIREVLKTSKEVLYINFDDEVLKGYSLSEVYHAYLQKGAVQYLFIDEIQGCKEWTSFLKKLYDTKEVKQIWISGSNSSLIKREYSSLLTGRNLSIKVHSLSFREFLDFHKVHYSSYGYSKKEEAHIQKLFQQYVKFGAFPELALQEVNQKELLINYFEDFLYKDIVARFNVNSLKLRELCLFLASNVGKPLSYRNVAEMLSFNYDTVIDYLSYLKDVFLFREVYAFDFSAKRTVIRDKKIYAIDTGLARAVSFEFSENIGRMLENVVFNELVRRGHEVYFSKGKKECDFIIKEGLKVTEAIQVCASLDKGETKDREMAGLLEAMTQYKLQVGIILTEDEEGEEKVETLEGIVRVVIKPLWKWLLETKK